MDLSQQEKRDLASLKTVKGYWLLVEKVLVEQKTIAFNKMLGAVAKGPDAFYIAGVEYCVWNLVGERIVKEVQIAEEELKREGDVIYA